MADAMISVAEARGRILAAVKPLPAETVTVAEAVGRVSAIDIAARRTQPVKTPATTRRGRSRRTTRGGRGR